MEVIKRTTNLIQPNIQLSTEDEAINIESKQFNDLLRIYEIAMIQVKETLNYVKQSVNDIYGYPLIEKISSRVKTKESIVNKLKKKDLPSTYISLVDNINDVAGVRVVCPIQEDIQSIVQVIKGLPNIEVLEEKDYISKPKKSGYKAYHMIIETPVKINRETVVMKVEIQIRTTAMDFWAEMEHDIRYKTNKEISKRDSKRLTLYAKNLEKLQQKIVKLYRKQENDSMYFTM